MKRLQTLDGWRGISILLVLCTHWVPLSPKNWRFNEMFGPTGMAIFFILSGFLITTILIKDQNIGNFIIRRFTRIIPLAWIVLIPTFLLTKTAWSLYLPNLFFYANWEPMALTQINSHYWSLCVEMQFYILIAVLVFVFKKKGLYILPILCLSVTALRVINGVDVGINTYYRIDEIMAGCTLALINNQENGKIKTWISKLSPLYLLPLLFLCGNPYLYVMNFFRPVVAMLLIGSTLFSEKNTWYQKVLNSRFLCYIATVSYAVYIFHGVLDDTWLGSGAQLEKYLKRPLLAIVTFGLAHLSTFYFENHCIAFGKLLTKKSKSS